MKGSKDTPRKLGFFMDGAWHESKSGDYMPVTNSSTGELMAEAPRCTQAASVSMISVWGVIGNAGT